MSQSVRQELDDLRKKTEDLKDNDAQKFFELVNYSLQLARAHGTPKDIAHYLMKRVRAHDDQQNYSAAREDLDSLKQMCIEHDELRHELNSVYSMYGYISDSEHDYQHARECYTKALELTPEHDTFNKVAILNNLSLVYSNGFGDLENAVYYLKKALVCASPGSEVSKVLLFNLSNISVACGDYETGRAYIEEVKEIGLASANEHSQYYYYQAVISSILGNYDEAFELADSSLRYAIECQRMELITNSYAARAEAHYLLGDVIGSNHDYNEQIKRHAAGSYYCMAIAALARNHANLAANIKMSDTDDQLEIENENLAEHFINLCNEIISTAGDSQQVACLRRLSEAYSFLGKEKSAHEYLKRSVELDSKIYSVKVKHEISSLRLLMKIEREEREKEIIKMKRDQLERELASTTMQLLTQTELLAEFRDGILDVIRKTPATEPITRALKEKLKELPGNSIDWEKFEAQFKTAHPEFSLALNEQFPDLTKMERRICILLRMNLTSSEISQLASLSERTIENHRFTIRKKLKLKKEQDLAQVLLKL